MRREKQDAFQINRQTDYPTYPQTNQSSKQVKSQPITTKQANRQKKARYAQLKKEPDKTRPDQTRPDHKYQTAEEKQNIIYSSTTLASLPATETDLRVDLLVGTDTLLTRPAAVLVLLTLLA